jgi:hypothetical protein
MLLQIRFKTHSNVMTFILVCFSAAWYLVSIKWRSRSDITTIRCEKGCPSTHLVMAVSNSRMKRMTERCKDMSQMSNLPKQQIAFHLWYMLVMKCACCGGDMLTEKDIGNSVLYKCADCGLSDTRIKNNQGKRADSS